MGVSGKDRVVIECKNYIYGVSIGKVRDFYGVISELDNVKGNVITSIDELKKREPDNRPNDNTIIYCLKDSYVQNKYWGLVKINEVMFEDEHSVEENTYSLDAGRLVRAVWADALGGERMVIM